MFEYLGVLIAVILGLSLTHLLRGLSRLIHMRRTVKPYWVQIVWTVNILIYVLAVWWGMFWWNRLQAWSIEEFFAIAAYCVVLFMLSSMLYPPECPVDLCHPDFDRADCAASLGSRRVRAAPWLLSDLELLPDARNRARLFGGVFRLHEQPLLLAGRRIDDGVGDYRCVEQRRGA